MKEKEWKIKYDIPEISPEFKEKGYSELLALVLTINGHTTPELAEHFINVSIDDIHDPFDLKDMDAAVDRIKTAIANNEKIAVYGDYDVDGITATSIVTDYLESKGLTVEPYIPDRLDEGYGLNTKAIDYFKEQEISLVITVDCGITAANEVEYAKSLGIDMIITDHHECLDKERIPKALAVVDYKRSDCTYPSKILAGVGVAFKLICAVDGNSEEMLKKYSDLVAIGTIADVMPLIGENRFIVIEGLKKLRTNPRPGLAAMLEKSGVDKSTVNASTVGYSLSPRINAAGRMGKAITAQKLVMATDPLEADELAERLCDLNKERQRVETEIWQQALTMLEDKEISSPIVLYNDRWHQGVIGIAASKLAEHFSLPTIMICLNDDGIGKGSCRSFGNFNIFEALSACKEHLLSFGGHPLAAGINIKREKINDFSKALADYYRNNKPTDSGDITPDILINDPKLLSVSNVKSLDSLEPYGSSNPKPLMCMCGVYLQRSAPFGKEKNHLKMNIVACGKTEFECIFFSHTMEELGIHDKEYIDIIFTPKINEVRGSSVQLTLVAARKHNGAVLCEDIKGECKYNKAAKFFKPVRDDFKKLWKSSDHFDSCPEFMVDEMFEICRKAFLQTNLIDSNYKKVPNPKHVNIIEDPEIMKRLNDT